jgi:hypothetical protein
LVTTFIDIARHSHPRLHPQNIMTALSHLLLSAQDANTTDAVIAHFSADPAFLSLSEAEGTLILSRDEEDASKLQKGIDIAKSKGVIDPSFVPEEYVEVDVMGKSPDMVADEILQRVRAHRGQGGSGGGVVVLCGLSGTGKARMIVFFRNICRIVYVSTLFRSLAHGCRSCPLVCTGNNRGETQRKTRKRRQ